MGRKNDKVWDFISNYVFPGIVLIMFGGLVLDSVFGDNGGPVDYDSYLEEKALYEHEQMIEDHFSDLEYQDDEATLYYIDNGYYFHDDINCKGLDGYRNDDLNITSTSGLYEHQELSACNWCVKGNN